MGAVAIHTVQSEGKRKVALVTGAGVRLGRCVALDLARRGYAVLLHYHQSRGGVIGARDEIRAFGGSAETLRADLSRGKECVKLARNAEGVFGRIDVLVNNAGIFWPTPLEKLNEKELDAFLSVNLKAPYLLSCEIGRQMKKRGSGAIINLACVSALRPWKEFVPYSISKAGVWALTVGLAKLLAPEVRVNAIAPGPVLPPEHLKRSRVDALAKRVPLKRVGTAEEISRTVGYLLDAEYVTGQMICVDGGRSIV